MLGKIIIGTITIIISAFVLPVFLIVSIGRFFSKIFEDWRVIGWAFIGILGIVLVINLIHHWAFNS